MAKVTVKCYGTEQVYPSRKKAIEEFRVAIMCSEGCEQARYTNILMDLLDGKDLCTDED